MSNQEILTKAIEKAIAGGWIDHPFAICTGCDFHEVKSAWTPGEDWDGMTLDYPQSFIYNHDFAKALWGEDIYYCQPCGRHHDTFNDCDMGCGNNQEAWAYHLQQMVVSPDPLKYLEENL